VHNKVILFTVNVDWFFLSHRLNLAQAALNDGYEVHLATSFTNYKSHIESLGIHVHDLDISRGKTSIGNALLSIISIFQIIRLASPGVIHAITLKVSILSVIASTFHRRVGLILAISGLGYIYTESSFSNSFKKVIIYCFFQIASMKSNLKIIFQNRFDMNELTSFNKALQKKAVLIHGSGVDLEKYYPQPLKDSFACKKVVFASRLLFTKGIKEFVSAIKIFNSNNNLLDNEVEFIIAGDFDDANPACIPKDSLQAWSKIDRLKYIGYQENLHELFDSSYIFVLPSYREGMPLVICQAMASGLPTIASNIPGCKDAVQDNNTGILVPVRDSFALYEAIQKLLSDEGLRNRMSINAHAFAVQNFNIVDITKQHMQLYNSALIK
tara:strand:- start:940 stop:2088 length:1149 start_codon:yes stop_codon:yes gene_type:complete